MGCDTRLAGANNAKLAAHTLYGRAATSWLTLITGLRCIIKIRTSRALQQITRRRRFVPQLTRCAGQ
jgi:hypothetical protein